jgi:hypothetical protein
MALFYFCFRYIIKLQVARVGTIVWCRVFVHIGTSHDHIEIAGHVDLGVNERYYIHESLVNVIFEKENQVGVQEKDGEPNGIPEFATGNASQVLLEKEDVNHREQKEIKIDQHRVD